MSQRLLFSLTLLHMLLHTIAIATPAAVLLLDSLLATIRRFSFSGSHVVITGGSSGIGLAIAKALLILPSPPGKVTIAARTLSALNEAKDNLKDDRIQVLQLDVTDAQACMKASESLADVDVLINCAGTSLPGVLETLSIHDIDHTIQLNLLGSIYLTRALLPHMKAMRKGKIIFVSSQAGQAGLYGYTAYSASKFGLRGFAEALAMEVAPFNISVSVAFPPDTDTPCLAKENLRKPELTRIISASSGLMKAEDVANKLIAGACDGQFLISMNMDGWFLTSLTLGMPLATRGILETLVQLLLLPFLRLLGLAYNTYFYYLIYQHS